MPLALVLGDGAAAEVIRSDGTHVVLQSARAAPPGSTVVGTASDGGRVYRVKVRGCRKTEAGALPFVVEGRLVDATREQREALLAATR